MRKEYCISVFSYLEQMIELISPTVPIEWATSGSPLFEEAYAKVQEYKYEIQSILGDYSYLGSWIKEGKILMTRKQKNALIKVNSKFKKYKKEC